MGVNDSVNIPILNHHLNHYIPTFYTHYTHMMPLYTHHTHYIHTISHYIATLLTTRYTPITCSNVSRCFVASSPVQGLGGGHGDLRDVTRGGAVLRTTGPGRKVMGKAADTSLVQKLDEFLIWIDTYKE